MKNAAIPIVEAFRTFPAIVAAVSLCTLAVFTARAEVLVYEGFHSQDYTTTTATELKEKKPTGHNTGFSSDHAWSANTAVPKTIAGSLTLGASFDISETNVTGRAIMNNGGTEGKGRGIYRKFTASMPTGGSVYFRFLMKLNSNASDYTGALQSGGYWAGGFVQNTFSGGSDDIKSLTTDGIWMGYKKVGSAISLFGRIGSTDYVFPYTTSDSTLSTWSTYIFIARVDIGAGTDGKDLVSLAVQPIATGSYSLEWDWTVKNVEANIVSGGTPVSYIAFAGQYQTNSKEVAIDQFKIATSLSEVCNHAAETRPEIGAISLTRTGAAEYSLSADEDANAADIAWIANDGASATTNGWKSVVGGDTASWTISNLSADKTYKISILATNESGTAEVAAGTLYTGALSFGAATDAYEYGSVTGGVVVARATADPIPLTVNYTISGSPGTEGTTWTAPVAVTIPANAASAVLPVVPLMDGDVTEDVTITVALVSGNYELPTSNAATLTLVNLAAPPGKKTWVATANGNASDGANWSPSGAPTAVDEILFDGNFSNARCIWDVAATHSVASWEQAAAFTGTVELQTTYESGAFAALAITGDCTINGGTMTQTKNEDAQVYRLSLTVGGDFSVASGAQVTATGKGYDTCHYPAGSACGVHGGAANDLSLVYGSLKHPVDIGSAGSTSGFKGGGAIHLAVAGDATIDGMLAARPSTGSTQSDTRYKGHGAGGSIYLSAASVAGSGSITAAGYGFDSSWQRPGGAGGRIAVICTTAESLTFPTANLMCNGSIASYGNTTGAGTIFVKTASQQNGTLIVDNALTGWNQYEAFWPTKRGVTPIPAGASWTLDEVKFRRFGVLCVPVGTSLSVPISGVSADSDRTAGILYEGGVLDFGSAPYTLAGKWTFQADCPYTFNGDVTVTGGANIGGLRFSGNYTNDFAKCDVVVNGNLTIASDGYASVQLAGPVGQDGNGTRPNHGGQCADVSGNKCYGSVFEPILPGHYSQNGNHGSSGPGGGALRLTVTGNLAVDGRISADGVCWEKTSAAAGSINIMAATISGSGSITARGYVGTPWGDPSYNGPGGRIAVRTTGEEIGTTGVWAKFAAMGCSTNQLVNNGKPYAGANNQNSSAGTIYL
ncbi:MAG: hypothetical protein K6G94_05260, partial [Kiritimatiellae bacterium]|nr:hypothetical protein [Kiritimatiellia bacterium]